MLSHLTFPIKWEGGRASLYTKMGNLWEINHNFLNYSFGIALLVRFRSSPFSLGLLFTAVGHSGGHAEPMCLNPSFPICFSQACSSLHGP